LLRIHYRDSLQNVVEDIYPNHPWQWWKSNRVQAEFWQERRTQRLFFESLANERGLKTFEDYYGLTSAEASEKGGNLLMSIHRDSMFNALSTAFPEHTWQPWKFSKTQRHLWHDIAKVLTNADETGGNDVPSVLEKRKWVQGYLEEEANRLRLRSLADWYRVTPSHQLSEVAQAFGGLPTLLTRVFPDHTWDYSLFTYSAKRSVQYSLIRLLERLLPHNGTNPACTLSFEH